MKLQIRNEIAMAVIWLTVADNVKYLVVTARYNISQEHYVDLLD